MTMFIRENGSVGGGMPNPIERQKELEKMQELSKSNNDSEEQVKKAPRKTIIRNYMIVGGGILLVSLIIYKLVKK